MRAVGALRRLARGMAWRRSARRPGTETEAPIFLSFRRSDTQGYAVSLESELSRRYGRDSRFFDYDYSPVGSMRALSEVVRSSTLVLVVIGPDWSRILNERFAHGGGSSDAVSLELQAALRYDVPLLAVLVGGASSPEHGSLPAPLGPLADIPRARLRDAHWESDLDALVHQIERWSARTR
jgi:hypothetical protein